MKKLWAGLIVVVLATLVVGGVSLKKTNADGCTETGENHSVIIKDGIVKPSGTITANVCDTFSVTNMDSEERLIAFGQHDHHIAYDGVSEKSIQKGQSMNVTLDKPGTYHWHDHEHDEVEGYFKVSE